TRGPMAGAGWSYPRSAWWASTGCFAPLDTSPTLHDNPLPRLPPRHDGIGQARGPGGGIRMAAAIAALADSISIGDLVLEDRAHRSVYTDPQIFDLEMARIFAGSWAYVGHESEVAHPGDYTTCTIGRQPVLLTRDEH